MYNSLRFTFILSITTYNLRIPDELLASAPNIDVSYTSAMWRLNSNFAWFSHMNLNFPNDCCQLLNFSAFELSAVYLKELFAQIISLETGLKNVIPFR